MKRTLSVIEAIPIVAGTVAFAFGSNVAAADGSARGTLTYKSKVGVITMTPKYAYLVKGPDAVDDFRRILK